MDDQYTMTPHDILELHINNSTSNTDNISSTADTSLDWSDDYYDIDDQYSTALSETYIVLVVFAIIFIVGILGNGTLALIFARHRNIRTETNTYILNLAVGDLLFIVAYLPFFAVHYDMESWLFGELLCKSSEFFNDVTAGVSAFTLIALNTVKPQVRRRTSKTLTILSVLGIWVLALVLALPTAIFSYLHIIDFLTIDLCIPFGLQYFGLAVLLKFLVYFVIPLCFIACFYVLTAIRHLRIPGMRNVQGQSPRSVASKQVSKIVLCFVVVFVVCFLPYYTFPLWLHYHPDASHLYNEYWHAFRNFSVCLGFFHSCANPIALYCLSDEFRKHFNNYLFHCRSCKRSGSLAMTSTIVETTMVDVNPTLPMSSVSTQCLTAGKDVKMAGERSGGAVQ